MIRIALAVSAVALAANAPVSPPPTVEAPKAPAAAALPGFAPVLAQMPAITGPAGWNGATGSEAWQALATAATAERQAARWRFAVGQIADERGADALGALDVMLADDPDLALVGNFQLARGAALAMLKRDAEALTALAAIELTRNPEACLWRMRAFAHSGNTTAALAEMPCAVAAINGRQGAARAPHVLAAASAAIDAGQQKTALQWLAAVPDRNGAANVLRGRAMLATPDLPSARLRFERAAQDTDRETVAEANLGVIVAALAAKTLKPAQAIDKIRSLRFGWRGGPFEARALQLEFRLSVELNDLRSSLRAGAALVRYVPLGAKLAPMLAQLQAALGAALAPDSRTPLADAAGLYWDYRELAPAGAEGDLLVLHLAKRLQDAGLYARAAELLEYQMTRRAADVAQGPLSVKVAALHILSAQPQRALDALRSTEQAGYTEEMRWDRKRMEAVALHQLGRREAAVAALEGVPDADAIRSEIEWRAKDWSAFVARSESRLPSPGALSEPARATLLRHAIALAMLGRKDAQAALHGRYAAAFKGTPEASAFELLTGPVDTIDPAKLSAAMASIPTPAPPASIGDLLDAGR